MFADSVVAQASADIWLEKNTPVSITVRNDGRLNSADVSKLILATARLWLQVVKAARGEDITFAEPITEDPVVTACGDALIDGISVRLEVNSDTPGRVALNTVQWQMAALRTMRTALEKQGIPQMSDRWTPPPTNHGANTPAQNQTPSGGVIQATRAPSPKSPQYQPGQQVRYKINKVALGSKNGSATYELWGPYGRQQYPITTIYRKGTNGEESPSWKILGATLSSLGLSVDNDVIVKHGDWNLLVSIQHGTKDGATVEYLNPVSLTPA